MTRSTDEDERRWAAVLARDRAADGEFVFAVRSTRIYCRPSCPSRRPRRDRVAFYPSPEAAEGAGFRACHRCRPGDAPRDALAERIRLAVSWIDRHHDRSFTLAELAHAAGCSPSHLQRGFTQLMGASPREYQASLRVKRLKRSLRGGAAVADAAYEAGFGSSSRVYERTDDSFGMTPRAYRRGGAGQDVRYVTAPCALGVLLVAATDRGICAVRLGRAAGPLVSALRAELPAARVSPGDPILARAVPAIVASIEGNRADLARLPLDLRGTAFQQRVWRALSKIPRGTTVTYAELARAIGSPAAVRAVGSACAANRVALVIPCHRVVPSTGGVGGYRWGPERKRALLHREGAQPGRRDVPGPDVSG